MKRQGVRWGIVLACLLVPGMVWAAGGGGASELVVVADTRMVSNGIYKYFCDLYNVKVLHFAVWATALTAMYGAFLGFLMDKMMAMTGLDLTSRKIVEH